MSQIKLSSNASGTGIFTLASPATNTNRTLTLPDNTGTILTSATTTGFPAGSVIQMVTATSTGSALSTSSDTYVDSGLAITITPTSATSKILVSFTFTSTSNQVDVANGAAYNIRRNDTTELFTGNTSVKGLLVYFNGSSYIHTPQTFTGVDSPATTSATEYSLYYRRINSVAGNVAGIQRDWGGITMIAMEISA